MKNLAGKHVAVTGATGMLGRELVRQLAGTGAVIRLVVRNAARLDSLLKALPDGLKTEIFECELVNPVELKEAFTGIDIVFHCAARVSFHLADDSQLVRTNTDITHHVVNACIDAEVDRLVHVSSIAALGEPNEQGVIDADSYPDSVAGWNGYSLSKFYSENEVWRGIRYGLKATIVNPSIILGPGDWKGEGSAALFAALSSGMPFYVPGVNGYVDLRDVAQAMIALSTASGAVNKRFILNGSNLSYKEFITLASQSMGRRKPRWKMGEKGLNRTRKLSEWFARITRTKPLLTEGLVRAALGDNRYDGETVKQVIDFSYRPIGQTMQYLAAAYLADKKHKKENKPKKS